MCTLTFMLTRRVHTLIFAFQNTRDPGYSTFVDTCPQPRQCLFVYSPLTDVNLSNTRDSQVPMNTSATPGHFKDHGYIALGLGKTFHQANGAWNAAKYATLHHFADLPRVLHLSLGALEWHADDR